MKLSTRARRFTVAAVTAPLVLVGLALPAQAAETDDTAGWLAGQLTSGLIVNDQFSFNDYGLTIDTYFALETLGGQDAASVAIITALDGDAAAYIEGGTPGDRYAGSLGKLLAAVETAGVDGSDFGGFDLVEELEDRVQPSGRATDDATGYDENWEPDPEIREDYSNTIGQAWVVRGLALAGSPAAVETADYLADQQCADGGFRVVLGAEPCVSDTDATAFAIFAFLEYVDAEAPGAEGLESVIDEAAGYLLDVQAGDGSFIGDGVANTNSTGLAAFAFDLLGLEAEALAAADWVRGRLVTPAAATGGLAGATGAIALDDAAFAAGQTDGLGLTIDQWRRATAQAAFALTINPPAGSVGVNAPGTVEAGAEFTVTASGLAPRESVTVSIDPESEGFGGGSSALAGVVLPLAPTATVVANASGDLTASLTAPLTSGTYQVSAAGAGTGRTGLATVTIVPASSTGGGTGTGNDTSPGGSASTGATSASSAQIPDTGSDTGLWALVAGVALVAAGTGVVVTAWRRAEVP